jgi:low affinity Fe/Cu permease
MVRLLHAFLPKREYALRKGSALNGIFRKFAHVTSDITGSPWCFLVAFVLVILWVVAGPYFHYSDTWQLTINTGTTIVTFLMVFLIQNTQNRDTKALHLKLDELIRVVHGARNSLVNLEEMSDEELDKLKSEFQKFQERNKCSPIIPANPSLNKKKKSAAEKPKGN